MKILATEKFNSQETPIKLLEIGDVDEFDQWLPDDRSPLLNQMKNNYDALFIGLKHKIDAKVMSMSPNLKVIATRTTGLDCIDLDYCKEKGIEVLSLRGEEDFMSSIPATAELTFLKMGELLRRDGHELKGKTLGIIGYGRIGKLLRGYAEAFGMIVDWVDIKLNQYWPRTSEDPSIDSDQMLKRILQSSDIVSLHITADEENRNFMDRNKFKMMKQGSYFLNSSREWLVDSEALYDALYDNLAGAWSDFLVSWDDDKLIQTPHQGGKTIESLIATEVFMAEKLIKYAKKIL